jgi:siroheme synthase-like protein
VPSFPLFINLAGQKGIVIGGGPVAARKARVLLDFGAKITIIAPELSASMQALTENAALSIRLRPYGGQADLMGAVLVAAAADDPDCNKRISEDAKNLHIPVNVADDPELCTFYFPALVRRGELVGAISSSGGCPRLAGRLREELEKQWPEDLDSFLESLIIERKHLRKSNSSGDTIQKLDRLITAFLKRT